MCRTCSKVLVTGATGFLGSAIVSQCQAAGFSVTTTGRSDGYSKRLSNYFKADLLMPDSLSRLFKDVDCVVHAAGLAHLFGKNQETAPFMAVNADGTENLIKAAASASIRHFILISSVAVYGSSTVGICTESTPCMPQSPYAKSKFEAELKAIRVAEAVGTCLTILRMATVYGKGDPGNVARLIRAVDQDHFIWIGAGSNYKSLIHRDDAARACVTILHAPTKGINIYNISAPPCTMYEVVNILA